MRRSLFRIRHYIVVSIFTVMAILIILLSTTPDHHKQTSKDNNFRRTGHRTSNLFRNDTLQIKEKLPDKPWHTNMEERIERLYKAAKVLVEELPDQKMFPRELLSHLKVLRTRKFTEETRPYRCERCMEWTYKTKVHPWNVCGGNKKGKNLMLLTLLTTVPKDVEGRKVIRETWGSISRNNTGLLRILFLFGDDWSPEEQAIIDAENREFGDLLQANFHDNYYNLTLKVLMGFRWAIQHCPQVDYVLRTGTDNFINIPGLYGLLTMNRGKYQRGAIGKMFSKMPPYRITDRKWFLSPRDITDEYLPDYPIGSAFVFSLESVKELVRISPYVPFFPLEDQYFGYCMQALSMPGINVLGFNYYIMPDKWLALVKKNSQGQNLCPFQMPWYSVHEVDPNFMRNLWAFCIDSQYKYLEK